MEGHATRRASGWYLLGQALSSGALILAGLIFCTGPAFAGDGTTTIQCGGTYGPSCTLSASTPAQGGSSFATPLVHEVSATTGSGSQCRAPNNLGQTVPCDSPDFGWLGSDGCYYQADPSFQPPPSDTADQPPAGETGSYYLVTCAGQARSTNGGIAWLPRGAAGAAAPAIPNPAILAQQAVSKLTLPSPQIESSPAPSADQLVGLPIWLWLGRTAWQAAAATAAVPGESVTATATPVSVTWSFGDGTTLVCQGPGTPYAAADNPDQPSPTCGHTYITSSADQPDDAFSVSATVLWSVSWAGGGKTGTVPALRNAATTALRVADVQSLNTAFVAGSETGF